MKKHDYAIFIGRFQPIHSGHIKIIEEGLKLANKVLILVGSYEEPRSIKNPFTYNERKTLIVNALAPTIMKNIIIKPIYDFLYDEDNWIKHVNEVILNKIKNHKAVMIGYEKDDSSYYLKKFPQYGFLSIRTDINISSTTIRKKMFLKQFDMCTEYNKLPKIKNKLTKLLSFDFFSDLQKEYEYINNYKEQWKCSPYPPIFVTGDSIVLHRGKILLIKRKNIPGIGLWALPGGFIEKDEYIHDGIKRELIEETSIDQQLINNTLRSIHVYDKPSRSLRGRIITHVGIFYLDSEINNNKEIGIKAGDDAIQVKWWPLENLTRNMMFNDHLHIIENIIKNHL